MQYQVIIHKRLITNIFHYMKNSVMVEASTPKGAALNAVLNSPEQAGKVTVIKAYYKKSGNPSLTANFDFDKSRAYQGVKDAFLPTFFCSLHAEALEKLEALTIGKPEGVNLRAFTDRPEVARDLAEIGLIKSHLITLEGFNRFRTLYKVVK